MNTQADRKPSLNPNAALARAITWTGSKQTYYTTRLLVDKDMVEDCYRAYAYFRWADDVIDADSGTALSQDQRTAFIKRQRALIEQSYRGECPNELTAQEELVAVLIGHDRQVNPGLESFIHNFLALLEFDAGRRGRLISQQELDWYSTCLARAVTDGIHYFIGHHHTYPMRDNRYDAVFAAHIVHMLRDMASDIAAGYINIPREYIQAHHIIPGDMQDPQFRTWVRGRVELARSYLQAGKQYLAGLEVLRAKIAGYWYCARYAGILDTIERDGYVLRREYKRSPLTWFRIAWIGILVALRHAIRRATLAIQWKRAQRESSSDPQTETAIAKQQKGVWKRL